MPTKKLTKHVKKKVNKARKKHKWINVLLIVIVLAVGIYLYYDSLNQTDQNSYSSEQNSEGFYYYQTTSDGYYQTTQNLIGVSLKEELNDILNDNFTPRSYQDAKTVLLESDLDPNNPNKLLGIYDSTLIDNVWNGNVWNREHVWPNSRLGIPRVSESTKNIGTDLHNLRVIEDRINSVRSNLYYVEGSGSGVKTGEGFYPGDDHKGDVARILFYMVTMYDHLNLSDTNIDEGETYSMSMVTMGKLSLLLEWHKEDPVDEFEKNRNQVIYGAQGNRNPYIDRPEFVHLIWENKTIDELTKPVEDLTTYHQGFRVLSFHNTFIQ
ncbi:endonuclease I [Acholeplasma morum]|uniref:endonuclease I family protein n=1 Tax=Paracholeplasma morum TaxID=264637 RepID=UPI00195B7411|nr:endonuclease [Paracholeplasma morum]MBM7453707.1 endonuclease I [Paracholeplasma morum]